jgi:hypothetical protein
MSQDIQQPIRPIFNSQALLEDGTSKLS